MKRRDFLKAAAVAPLAPAAVAEPTFEHTEASLGFVVDDPDEQAVLRKGFGRAALKTEGVEATYNPADPENPFPWASK